ncbi:MAG TPA: OsmC family protein [Pyrinomonadaceae bacterium]|nr:OsmC family protein [Pyrinomonadaceae bacterium]
MQQAVKEQKMVNGVNVDELVGTIEAVRQQPELATMQFRANNEWINGGNNQTSIKGVYGAGQEQERQKTFVLEKDEPVFLLGTDKGANPVEYALAALAGCLTTTLVYFAAAEGVKLDEVTSKFEGDASLLGFLGLDENTRMGCDEIRVTFDIKSDAPKEKIQELVELAQARSGVFDMLTNKTPVSIRLAD